MGAVQKINIEVSEELIGEVEAGLASGDIDSWNTLIEEALLERLMRRPDVVKHVRVLIDEALSSGDAIEGLPDFEDIKRRGRERLTARL